MIDRTLKMLQAVKINLNYREQYKKFILTPIPLLETWIIMIN